LPSFNTAIFAVDLQFFSRFVVLLTKLHSFGSLLSTFVLYCPHGATFGQNNFRRALNPQYFGLITRVFHSFGPLLSAFVLFCPHGATFGLTRALAVWSCTVENFVESIFSYLNPPWSYAPLLLPPLHHLTLPYYARLYHPPASRCIPSENYICVC